VLRERLKIGLVSTDFLEMLKEIEREREREIERDSILLIFESKTFIIAHSFLKPNFFSNKSFVWNEHS
jgi:hypothetical protein